MRRIKDTSRFRRDLKRELRGRYRHSLESELTVVLQLLAEDQLLPVALRDHSLEGEWRGCRDCHIHPDLVLIYRKPDENMLELLRLASHSELDF